MGPGFEPLRAYKERDWDNIKIPFILGGMVEWSITTVLKTVVLRGTGGSNPSPSAIKLGKSSVCKLSTRKSTLKRLFRVSFYPLRRHAKPILEFLVQSSLIWFCFYYSFVNLYTANVGRMTNYIGRILWIIDCQDGLLCFKHETAVEYVDKLHFFSKLFHITHACITINHLNLSSKIWIIA